LNDMLDAEHQMLRMLEESAGDATRKDLQKAFSDHRAETQHHFERLQACFALLNEKPQMAECHGIRGLVDEKDMFLESEPSEDLVDMFNVAGAIKAEAYEICAYESLVQMARQMKYKEVGRILSQILREERAALKKMLGFARRIKPSHWIPEEQETRGMSETKMYRLAGRAA